MILIIFLRGRNRFCKVLCLFQAPEGENQPSTEVDLFISTEKIMVLNTELKEIMMDHALRTISYIADIGDLVVLMARRRFVPHENDSDQPKLNRTPKMICHVFESEEVSFVNLKIYFNVLISKLSIFFFIIIIR